MKIFLYGGPALLALLMVTAAGTTAEAQKPRCNDKCTVKSNACEKAKENRFNRCVARVDKWKAKRDRSVAKAKHPGKLRAKVEAQYKKKRQVCEAAKTRAEAGCHKSAARCAKACSRPARAVKRPRAAKKPMGPKKTKAIKHSN